MSAPKAETLEDDKLFSVSQRFSYFQEKPTATTSPNGSLVPPHLLIRKTVKPRAKLKTARMTVRLRPRQVLCSKCRSICNENSENVDHSNKKTTQPFSENRCDNQPKNNTDRCSTLIPKLNRLKAKEISNAINGKVINSPNLKLPIIDDDCWVRPSTPPLPHPLLSSLPPKIESKTCAIEEDEKLLDEGNLDGKEEDDEDKMVLRKKRSVGSMEDLWDESVFEEATKKTKTTPVIKISFGSQGEGTVLEIPSKVQNCSESEPEEKHRTASVKAAKRALKKAKKEARRKFSEISSPGTSPAYEALHYRRHRHKVKHKKKHKEERKDPSNYTDMKERCLKQKLSISLRRLNATAYAHRNDSGLPILCYDLYN